MKPATTDRLLESGSVVVVVEGTSVEVVIAAVAAVVEAAGRLARLVN